MIKAATASDLKHIVTDQLATAQVHLERLEQVFELLGESPRIKKNEAIEGLAEDANDVIDETEKGSDKRDSGLVLAAQKIKSVEIDAYATLIQLAGRQATRILFHYWKKTMSEKMSCMIC